MSLSGSRLVWLDDPRLSPLAVSALPAWLWSIDATRVLWANATGAAIFGAPTPAALATRKFDMGQPAAAQIAQLATTLVAGGAPRLTRLRGFGAGIGCALPCACSNIRLADNTAAILVAAAEHAGPDLALVERVQRLLAGSDAPVAAFSAEGALIQALPGAQAWLNGQASLAALGAETLAVQARESGHAAGVTASGALALDRIGGGTATILIATFGAAHTGEGIAPTIAAMAPAPNEAAATESAPPKPASPPKAEAPLTAETVAPVSAAQELQPEPPAVPIENAPVAPEPGAPDRAISSAPPAPEQSVPDTPEPADRRHPLRFVWQIGPDGRFRIDSDEFIMLIGPQTAAALGQPWHDVAADLGLDPERQVARAIATRDTWSGLSIAWPVDDSPQPLLVELSGLPVFDRDRAYRGYRGFGVCRDLARLAALIRARQAASLAVPTAAALATESPHAQATAGERKAEDAAPATIVGPPPSGGAQRAFIGPTLRAENVVPFRVPSTEPAAPSLSPVERRAFRELARRLTERLTSAGSATDGKAQAGEAAAMPAADHTLSDLAEAAKAASDPPPGETAAEPSERDRDFFAGAPSQDATAREETTILDRLPFGMLIYRLNHLIYANRAFLRWTGHETLEALAEAGGLDSLFVESGALALEPAGNKSFVVTSNHGERTPAEGRLLLVPWEGDRAFALVTTTTDGSHPDSASVALAAARAEIGELTSILDSAKQAEQELVAAKRQAEKAASAKSDFLAKINHEVRTPLNTIIGFSEVMMEERFGPIGNERYRQYLKDIHSSGGQLISLINDLIDLSKIEAGKLELTFAGIALNDLTQQCVAMMQAQANRERIIIRTSLSPKRPQVVADVRSVRQIVLNLLSNSIKLTGAGGQVIVSTALTDAGEVMLHVRDTGIGMSEQELATALEPFRQLATSTRWGSGGTGLGLPLTKALAEANRASFHIKSTPNAGTLVEVTFPAARVLAE
jgi:signal transduction histidine kinase